MDPRFRQDRRDSAKELYESGLTVREVADKLSLSVARTHALLVEAGAEMRPPGQPRKESDEIEEAEESAA